MCLGCCGLVILQWLNVFHAVWTWTGQASALLKLANTWQLSGIVVFLPTEYLICHFVFGWAQCARLHWMYSCELACSIVLAVVSASKVIVIIEFKWVFRIQHAYFSAVKISKHREREWEMAHEHTHTHNMTGPIWRYQYRLNALKINNHLFWMHDIEREREIKRKGKRNHANYWTWTFERNRTNDKLLRLVQLRFNWIRRIGYQFIWIKAASLRLCVTSHTLSSNEIFAHSFGISVPFFSFNFWQHFVSVTD